MLPRHESPHACVRRRLAECWRWNTNNRQWRTAVSAPLCLGARFVRAKCHRCCARMVAMLSIPGSPVIGVTHGLDRFVRGVPLRRTTGDWLAGDNRGDRPRMVTQSVFSVCRIRCSRIEPFQSMRPRGVPAARECTVDGGAIVVVAHRCVQMLVSGAWFGRFSRLGRFGRFSRQGPDEPELQPEAADTRARSSAANGGGRAPAAAAFGRVVSAVGGYGAGDQAKVQTRAFKSRAEV
jgi:hypothetical protein